MKKLILIPLALIALFSCNKDESSVLNEVTNTQDAADELAALAANPATTSLVLDKSDSNKMDSSKQHCKFKHPGAEGVKIEFAELPQLAQDYINANNGGVTNVFMVLKITRKDNSIVYVVRLVDKKHIHFDVNGNKLERPKGDRKFEHISLVELPIAAQTYLSNNVDPTLILGAVKMVKPSGEIAYGVRLKNNIVYTFDADGNYTGTMKGKPKHK